MPRAAYISEHVRLVRRLENPTEAGLKAEAKEQREDLRKARQ